MLSEQPLKGERHDWNGVEGYAAQELTLYLRQSFTDCGPYSYNGKPPRGEVQMCDYIVEQDQSEYPRKVVLSGRLGDDIVATRMCGYGADKKIPISSICAFRKLFVEKLHGQEFTRLHSQSRGALIARGQQVKSNAKHFLNEFDGAGDWALASAQIHISDPFVLADRPEFGTAPEFRGAVYQHEGKWIEPKHTDGAGSLLHAGLTLFGARTCTFFQPADRKLFLSHHKYIDIGSYMHTDVRGNSSQSVVFSSQCRVRLGILPG